MQLPAFRSQKTSAIAVYLRFIVNRWGVVRNQDNLQGGRKGDGVAGDQGREPGSLAYSATAKTIKRCAATYILTPAFALRCLSLFRHTLSFAVFPLHWIKRHHDNPRLQTTYGTNLKASSFATSHCP